MSEFEQMRQRAIADTERNGGWVMKDPKIRKRPPRKPSWG
jgi:hypothetical protein